MSGRLVARLILACFLSSCGSPTENVVQQPPAKPPANLAASPTFIPASPVKADGATKAEISIKRGSCLEVVGTTTDSGGVKNTYEYCYYPFKAPSCTTAFSDCRDITTGTCSTKTTPPPC
jgi:hypothetical protein